ncbi:MAG TPA: hypothetical protein VHA11_13985 [Bryobacteraceae bacterium]|nr:hypothetical protein [Bryobacteraceae bacterium]
MPKAASTPARDASPGYLWQVPGRPLSVRLSEEAAREILKGGRRRSGRGEESGGVLLGRVTEQDGQTIVWVERAAEVPSEHLFGPRYSLSETDRELCQELVAESAHGGSLLRAVGFFRTHKRKGLRLDADDLTLMKELFPEKECVALVVKRGFPWRCRAGFFIWEEGQIRSEGSYREFDLRAARKSGPRRELRPAASLWSSWWLQAPLLVCLFAADALLGYASARQWYESRPAQPPASDPYSLSLLVLEYVDNLHLTWDRHARPIESGGSGLLHISDGDQIRTIELSSEQLRSGSVIYRKMNPHVRFRLEVFLKGGRSVSETWDSGRPGGTSL